MGVGVEGQGGGDADGVEGTPGVVRAAGVHEAMASCALSQAVDADHPAVAVDLGATLCDQGRGRGPGLVRAIRDEFLRPKRLSVPEGGEAGRGEGYCEVAQSVIQ